MVFGIRTNPLLLIQCMLAAACINAAPAGAAPLDFADLSTPVTIRLEWSPSSSEVPIERLTFELTDFWGSWILEPGKGGASRREKAVPEPEVASVIRMLDDSSDEVWLRSEDRLTLTGEISLTLLRGAQRHVLLPEGLSPGGAAEKAARALFSMLASGMKRDLNHRLEIASAGGGDVPWEAPCAVVRRGRVSMEEHDPFIEEWEESQRGIMREDGSQLINGRWINSYDLSHGYYAY